MTDVLEHTATDKAHAWADEQLARLTERVTTHLSQQEAPKNGALRNAAGAPVVGNYVAFDVAVTSPIQFGGPPPYQPSKIIAAGEAAFIFAFIFVNPAVNIPAGFAVPPTVQLGGRTWRASLDQLNLTSPTTLIPGQVQGGVFPAAAPALSVVVYPLATPNPGLNPAVIEANVTVDIVDAGQPYAAFATNFFDVDGDPGFLGIPPVAPGYRNELPNRYLVYSD